MIRLNLKLIRKPPPPLIEEPLVEPLSEELDFKEFDLETYLSKSPITSKYRLENPNLQPTSEDSDFDMYSSLDPSIKSIPPSPAISQTSYVTANGNYNVVDNGNGQVINDSPQGLGIGGLQLLSPHVTSNVTTTSSINNNNHVNNNGKFNVTTPLEPIKVDLPSNNKKFKDKFKRLSLNNLGQSKKFIPTHKKYNSDAGIKRLSTLNIDRNSHSPRLRSSSIISTASASSLADCNKEDLSTPYWKYHILKFGKDLYLTTNPSLKHMYCRNGPGYYIEVTNTSKHPDDGFTMVFKDAENQSDKSIPPIMIIEKKSLKHGGYLTISLTKSNQLKKNMIKTEDIKKSQVFNGLSIPQAIPDEFIPYDKISNTKYFEKNEANFQNYELRDFNNLKWNIGSIPRVRSSKFNKLKLNLDLDNGIKNSSSSYSLLSMSSRNSLNSYASSMSNEDSFKFMGVKNIYFHQNFVESNNPLPYKLNCTDPQDIYLQTSENSFPPVLGMFRPYEKKLTKKLVNSINKRFSKSFDKNSTIDINNFNKFNNKLVENDLSGGNIKNYYIAGDGLYYNTNPLDDLPDDNKLGWLTIYEDKLLQDKGMFDLVLGVLVAVGYENYYKST